MKIIKVHISLLAYFLIIISLFSCSKDNDETPAPYVDEIVHKISSKNITAGCFSSYYNLSFTVDKEWKITVDDESWILLSSKSGSSGDIEIDFTASTNSTGKTRVANIFLEAQGYKKDIICTITQESTSGKYVNNWISDIMTNFYLWNDEYKKIKSKLDYSLEPDEFLLSAVSTMDSNTDDGFVYNNKRYYYSNIDYAKYNVTSRTIESHNYGIGKVKIGRMSNNSNTYYFIVCYVYPGSSADKAGIKRGTIITKVNDEVITESNSDEAFNSLMANDAKFGINVDKRDYIESGDKYILDKAKTVSLSREDYDSNPILNSSTIEYDGHKIGYLAYVSFDKTHDEKLIDSFDKFKSDGITDLILDLRYNGGGYTNSSLALASAIIGPKYKGKVYSHFTFNKERTDKGETLYLYIGKDESYSLAEKIMDYSPNLKRLFVLCSESTASASELIINGLRGLDIEVKLIGDKTNGKNVGMEAMESNTKYFNKLYDFKDVEYELSAITFYSSNAKEFKDYASGFDVDCDVNEDAYLYADWGDYKHDPLALTTVYYICKGTWPELNRTRSITTGGKENRYENIHDPYKLQGTILIRK